jgi:hypothetical protein
MMARHIVVVLLADAIVDLGAEVDLAEERRTAEVGNETEDIALDRKELGVAAVDSEIEEQEVVDRTESVADSLEEAADIGLAVLEGGTVVDPGEPNKDTADLAELPSAPVGGSRKVAVDAVLEGADDNPGQAVVVLDNLAGPEGFASMEVVVKSWCEIRSNSFRDEWS